MTKILLVEDDKSLREIYGVRLLAEGYDIVSAGDGEEALAMAIKEKPQLIISDVMMPKISGFDMLDILRSTTETRDIKVIMMTALSSDDQRTRGEQLGADKYLVKSQVGIEDVVRTVHEVLGDGGSKPAAAAAATTAAPAADATAPASDTIVDGDAASTPATDSTPAPAPAATDTTKPEDTTVNPTDTTNPTAPTDPAADTSAPASAAPGNDDAGPLPPQPTETESTLPQPTAPFSSPRPANLGEQVVSPISPDLGGTPAPEVAAPEVADTSSVATELTATADPVNTQVDSAMPTSDDSAVPGGDASLGGVSPTPVVDGPAAPAVPAPEASAIEIPAPSVAPEFPAATPSDDTTTPPATPPAAFGGSPNPAP